MAVWCCLIVVFIIINRAQAAASPRHVNYQYHWENIEAQLLYLQNSLVRGRQRSWAWTWTTCHGTRSAPVRGWRNEKVIIWKPMAYCLLVAIPRMARIAPWSSAPSKSTELQGKEVINSMDCKYFKCLRNLNFTCYLFWGLTLEDSPCTKPSPAPASNPPKPRQPVGAGHWSRMSNCS